LTPTSRPGYRAGCRCRRNFGLRAASKGHAAVSEERSGRFYESADHASRETEATALTFRWRMERGAPMWKEKTMSASTIRIRMRSITAWSLLAIPTLLCLSTARAQPVSAKETVLMVQRALSRLPYYGVFDFLVFGVDRGVVTVGGFAYRSNLTSDAVAAIKYVVGADEVADTIEVLPASQNDDRIRWATFYKIYTDDFLSRYAPGGAMTVRYDALSFARFPAMQPFGTYPIHIIVKNGRTMLLGVVDSEADKTLAGLRAREITGVFDVENSLVVDKR
jgi:hyperosmotically inducible periplasmic protein